MKSVFLRGATIAAFSVTALIPAAFGQEAAMPATSTNKVVELEKLSIEGSNLKAEQAASLRTGKSLLNTPQSLSIFTAAQMADQGFTQVKDVIAYTPGVNTSQGEGHRDAVVFRGVRSTAAFFVDGMRDDVQYFRPIYNIEQVEVLRGPNALYFGRGAPGGLINRITKKGVVGETFNAFQMGIDSFGAADAQWDTNIALNDTSALRINILFENVKNHRDFSDGERFAVSPTYRVNFGEKTTLDLTYEYLDFDRFIDRGIPTGSDGEPLDAFENIVFGDPSQNVSTLEAHIFTARLQHAFSDAWRGSVSGLYGDYTKFYQNLYASGYNQSATPDQVTLDGYVDETERQNLVISADLIGEFDTGSVGHTLIVGAEFTNTDSDQYRFNAFWDTTEDDNEIFSIRRPLAIAGGIGVNAAGQPTRNDFGADIADDTRVTVETASIFLQDEIALLSNLDLILGARFDSFDISVNDVVGSDQRSRTDDEVSPRLGIVFRPQEVVALYASYSETFLPRSGEQYANLSGDRANLNPDEFVNLEAGVKWDIRPGLTLNAAIFEIQQTSAEVDDNDAAAFVEIESETTGFELQLQGQITDNWFVLAGYSYLDGEQVNQSGDTGLRPRELPENMFSIWNNYRVNARLGLGLGLIYQDESFINNSNSATLPSYTRVDGSVYYFLTENLRLQLNVENILDESYYPDAHSTHQATVGAPVNARFSISGRF